MAEIVNLRTARKAKLRSEKQAQAAANRAKFGQSKAAKASAKSDRDRAAALLDGAKREDD